MNKMTKLGASALCGSLAAISAANAGDLSVTGGVDMSWMSLDDEVVGNPLGIGSNLTFKGSGELDNGWTVDLSVAHANANAYSNTNVKLCGTHSGIAVGEDGPTAQMIVDLAYTRAMPNLTVIQPADWEEAYQATKILIEHLGPVYMRLGRPKVRGIYDSSYKFEIGKGNIICEGKDAVIFATGIMVQESLKAIEHLRTKGIAAGLVNISTIKPIDRELVVKKAKTATAIITAEDHNVIGGLGDAVLEVLTEEQIHKPFMKIGLRDTFAETGSMEDLFEKYKISSNHISLLIQEILKK